MLKNQEHSLFLFQVNGFLYRNDVWIFHFPQQSDFVVDHPKKLLGFNEVLFPDFVKPQYFTSLYKSMLT